MIITIDGPVASGKSSVARLVAQKLNYYYLATGMLYRAIAYVLINNSDYLNLKDFKPLCEYIAQLMASNKLNYQYINGQVKIFFDGKELTPYLKTEDMDQWSSTISTHQCVRDAVFHWQVAIGNQNNCVAEGRDTGTVVFPNAEHKFFLTASPEVRAKRWQADQKRLGSERTFEESLAAIRERDRRDEEREISPLKQASDAILVDNSHLDLNQTVEFMMHRIVVS